MQVNYNVLCHNSILLKSGGFTIYIDPFKIDKNYNDADMILITHSHYDHFSPEDIRKVKRENCKIIVTEDLKDEAKKLEFEKSEIFVIKPNENYEIDGAKVSAISAYNINKPFHPKENNWVGYVIEINGEKFYIAGDTDITDENQKVICDVAFVPIGGTYTMTAEEAAMLVNTIKPKIAVPTHYGLIVGNKSDSERFEKNISEDIKCEIFI